MANTNAQTNLISQAMMNSGDQQDEADTIDDLKVTHSIHDVVESGNFEAFKVSIFFYSNYEIKLI